MGDIYRRANDVVAWLGKEDPGSTFALESIQDMYNAQVFTQQGLRASIATAEVAQQNDSNQESLLSVKSTLDDFLFRFDFDAVIKSVGTLLERSWWRRLWVVQELVLSRQAFLRCGPLAVSWNTFEYFLDLCELFMLCYPADPAFYAAYVIGYKTFILSKCCRQVESGRGLTMFQLFEMMMTMTIRETSDPRDRVYALLGLADDAKQLGIRPNYSLSCAEVYVNTAMALIQDHGLIVLSYCSFGRREKVLRQEVPSWSPDLSKTVTDPLRGNANTSIYRASGSSYGGLRFWWRYHTCLLEVQSIVVGHVITKSNERPSPDASFDINKAKSIRKWLRKTPSCSPDGTWDEDMWRVPIANRISKRGQEASREANLQDKAAWEALISGDETVLTSGDEIIEDYIYSVWVRTVGRCTFTCSNGYVGLGSSKMKRHDLVVILLGSDVPFILRYVDNDQYRLVGEAYVHRVMQGELMLGSPKIKPISIQ